MRRTVRAVAIAGLFLCATAVRADAAAPSGLGICATAGVEGQGGTGGTANHICQGSGLVFVGPSVGQVAAVIGPTIIGPAVIGATVVAAGDGAVGSGAAVPPPKKVTR
jgi:hypothetical protein